MITVKFNIFFLKEKSKKVAFIEGNRSISKKNLNQKIASIKECGQLMPIVVVDGKDAAEEGLVLIDAETNEVVSNNEVENYLVIIEGQHRYTAIRALQKQDKSKGTNYAPEDIIMMYALNPKSKSNKKLISELNKTSIIWDGKDFITGAALCNPTNELLQYTKKLADMKSTSSKDDLPRNGYPLSTISKMITFGVNLDKAMMSKCMDCGTECLPIGNLSRARRIIDAAISVGFKHKYLAHRYFIDWIIDESNRLDEDGYCELILGLSPSKVQMISKIKGDNSTADIRMVVEGEEPLEEEA